MFQFLKEILNPVPVNDGQNAAEDGRFDSARIAGEQSKKKLDQANRRLQAIIEEIQAREKEQ